MTQSLFEHLPIEVLQNICECVGDARSLAMASKRCNNVARAVLFAKVTLCRKTLYELCQDIEEWILILKRNASFAHVRRLDLTLNLSTIMTPRFPPTDSNEAWQAVADFIRLLPGLAELHFSSTVQMRPCILAAVEAKGYCRLFVKNFGFASLIQRSSSPPISMSPYEVRLATSPSLYSIKLFRYGRMDTLSSTDFNYDAVIDLVAGLAPNLKEVYIFRENIHSIPANSRPQWRCEALIPQCLDGCAANASSVGSLTSLMLYVIGAFRLDNLQRWVRATDFSKLKSLRLSFSVDAPVFRWLASNVQLTSLNLLIVDAAPCEPGNAYGEGSADVTNSLVAFLETVPLLRHFGISCDCDDNALNQIVKRHESSLRVFRIDQRTPLYSSAPGIGLEWTLFQGWRFPRLEVLTMTLFRTNGDSREVRMYEWLGSNCPNLQELNLWLDCSDCGPEIKEEELNLDPNLRAYRLVNDGMYSMQYVLQNHAVDGTLARAIFRRISTSQPVQNPALQHMVLRVLPAKHSRLPDRLHVLCANVLACSWECTRKPRDDRSNDISINNIFIGDQEWVDKQNIGKNETEAYHDLWPLQPGQNWQECWRSKPLDTTDTNTDNTQEFEA